jgi:hypothetical protein
VVVVPKMGGNRVAGGEVVAGEVAGVVVTEVGLGAVVATTRPVVVTAREVVVPRRVVVAPARVVDELGPVTGVPPRHVPET